MKKDAGRLDGWKAIGAYFGRDRTTAIRWANERGLPVHKLPGGKTSTVYALQAELDVWLASQNAAEAVEDEGEKKSNRKRWPISIAFAAALGVLLLVWQLNSGERQSALPKDKKAAALFVQARDNAAQRNAQSIAASIGEFEATLKRQPDFAPAFAGLAEAYLLSAEYGTMSYDVAYGKAGPAAARALALEGELPAAHRVQAYVRYWWERDPVSAGKSFRRAIALDDQEFQTRFWYGGILADNGEFAAARREYEAARALNPGWLPIATHLALLKWREGDTRRGIGDFEALASQNPNFPLVRYFLGVAYLGEGDTANYLKTVRERATIRGSETLRDYLSELVDAQTKGGEAALRSAIIDRAMRDEAGRPFPDHSLPAFLASALGDRGRLISALRIADTNREIWGASGYRERILQKWQGDPDVIRLLEPRTAPKIEQ